MARKNASISLRQSLPISGKNRVFAGNKSHTFKMLVKIERVLVKVSWDSVKISATDSNG